MDTQQIASLTAILAPLFGAQAAGIASIAIGALFIAGQIMPYLPVPTAHSAAWYRFPYGVLAALTGNRGRNAPVPPAAVLEANPATLAPGVPANPAVKQ